MGRAGYSGVFDMTRTLALGLFLAGTALGSTSAFAQAEPDDARELEDRIIVVTSIKAPGIDAARRAGSLTAVGQEELDTRNVRDLADLTYVAPNVSLDPIGTFKGVANFSIRGLGINSSIPSIDPAVGLFVDGVYMGINAGTVFDLLDVERVEVLRGPQGVAFGRNTTGGAVLIATGNPTEEWMGRAAVSFETPVDADRGAPMAIARAVVSGPLTDRIGIRLAALHRDDGGYFENSFDGSAFGKERTTMLRGALSIQASDRLSLLFKGERVESSGDGAAGHNNGLIARDDFAIALDERGFYDSRSTFAVARAEYEMDIGVITNVFGWREYDLRTRNDIDSSPQSIFFSDTGTSQEQWSNELYYAADFGRLALTVGGYLFHQDIGYDEDRNLAGFGLPKQYGGGRQDHDVYGIYGQADYDLTRAVTLTAGLRYSREEKAADITYVRPRPACSAIDSTCPVDGINPATGENNGFSDTRSWSNFAPRLALAFRPAERATLYASWTRGYRSGGYNLRITQPVAFESVSAALGSPAFDEERVDSYEVGAKWHSADGRAHLTAAAFQTEVAGLQREVNVPSASAGLAQSVYNTADARIRGGEIEAEFAPLRILRLAANVGYIDARYTDAFFDISSDGKVDAADLALDLPRAPKWTWGGSAIVTVPAGEGAFTAAAFYQHRARYAYTDNNWGFNSASDQLDATLAYDLGEPGITMSVYGRNLLDEVQFGGDTQLGFAGGPFSDGTNRPYDPRPGAGTFSPIFKGRVLGLELAMEF